MNKITVTKLQMDAIKRQRDDVGRSLKETLSYSKMKNFCAASEVINDMSIEQIVLAWHGYAKIEKEYVSFDEAMIALKNGIDTYYHNEFGTMRVYAEVAKEHELMHLEVNRVGLLNLLFEGKWTIAGDTNE